MNEHRKDAILAARELTETLSELSDRLDRVTAREEKTRRLTWRTIIAVGIDIVLSMLLVVVYAQSRDNSVTLSELHANSVNACHLGNETRAQEIMLWDHLASISHPSPGETKARQERDAKAVAGLLAYIKRTFAPRDCQALYRAP